MRILIAEDDLTSRTMLAAVLNKGGHEVVETKNGVEAWETMRGENAPRMAILDWMMPEMDGVEAVRRIREREPEKPPYLIMLTTKGEKTDVVTGLDAGADDYLSKPFDPGELWARVDVGRRIIEMQDRLAQQVRELSEAMDHIKTLQGILPICSFCKKIRNDQGYWDQVEAYISENSQATFTHGICPDCMRKHYPEYAEGDADRDAGSDTDDVAAGDADAHGDPAAGAGSS